MERPPNLVESPSGTRRRCSPPVVFLLFSLGLGLALFHGVLFGDRQFNYRDEAHFYHPVFQYIRQELQAGRFPLWTPYDNLGQPLFANAAFGVLYPGKLIFFLPFDYSLLFNWYIVGHVFLAAATFYRLARFWNRSPRGATFGALAYAFGGSVFGLYSNPIFLVGAAWAPEAILHADRMSTRRSPREALLLAVVLALMLLGGDPQASYHFGGIAALLALFYRQRERRLLQAAGPGLTENLRPPATERPTSLLERISASGLFRNRIVLLGVAAAVAFLLTAVQILPSSDYTRHSDRSIAAGSGPRSVWEIPGYLFAAEEDGEQAESGRAKLDGVVSGLLFRRVIVDSHHDTTYNFSTHPAQFAQLVWPFFGGVSVPQNIRWNTLFFDVLRNPDWLTTFYIGIIPFLLAVSSLRFRLTPQADVRIVWLSWLLVLALGAATGYYGLGWMLDRCFGLGPDRTGIGHPVGGLYWLFQILLPGYAFFRYPAKWMTVAALPLALLAAYGWDRLECVFARTGSEAADKDRRFLFLRVAAFGIMLSSFFLVLPAAAERDWVALAPRIAPDRYLGPFQPEWARTVTMRAFLQTACVLLVLLSAIRFRRSVAGPVLLFAILSTTVVDLYFSCHRTLFWADRDDFRTGNSFLADTIREDAPEEIVPQRLLLHVAYPDKTAYPERWQKTSSPDRGAEAMQWDRNHLLFLFYYDQPRRLSGNLPTARIFQSGSMVPDDYLRWLRAAVGDEKRLEEHLASIGVRYVLMSPQKPLDSRLATPVPMRYPPDLPEERRSESVLWRLEHPRHRSWIERPGQDGANSESGESCRLVRYGPGDMVVEATLAEAGTVVLSEQYWSGWQVDVESLEEGRENAVAIRRGEIRPVREILQGVDLPAGSFRLRFRYAPGTFRCGALLSATAWILLVPALVMSRRRTGRNRP